MTLLSMSKGVRWTENWPFPNTKHALVATVWSHRRNLRASHYGFVPKEKIRFLWEQISSNVSSLLS